ncbi:MAG TPA: hypothetical protein VGI34_08380 [Candidatus Acidoferrales bacterium]
MESPQRDKVKNGIHLAQFNAGVRNFIVGASGTLTYFVYAVLVPSPSRTSVLQPAVDTDGPRVFAVQYRLMRLLNSPYILLPLFCIWIYLAISRRADRKSWIYAFLSGYLFPYLVFGWLLGWI